MAYTQEQINQAFASSKEKGLSDQQINEIANNIGLTEQNIFNARDWWLDTPAGQNYLSGATPLQQDWANTFWVGDMEGAQNVLNREKLTPQRLVTEYNVNPTEILNVTNRYGVVPFGGQAATAPPTNPTDQQQGVGGNGPGFGMWTIPDAKNPSFSYGPTTAEAGGWANRFTAGASDKAGLGNAGAYQSNVIQALRQASSQTPFSTNTGVSIIPNLTSRTPAVFVPGQNLAFNPPMIKGTTASNVVGTESGIGAGGGGSVRPRSGTIGGGGVIGGGATGGATGAVGAGGTTGTVGTSTGTAEGNAAGLPKNTGTTTNLITLPTTGSTDTKIPSVELNQDLETSNATAIPWNENEKFGLDQELGFIQQSDVPERGTAAFPQDFGYINPSDVPVIDRSVPSMSDANWGIASGSLLPDWAVDAAFGIKSATENPFVKTVFPLVSAVGGGLANETLDAQIDRLANQYAAIQAGNNLGYGTRVDNSGSVFYEAPVETRDIFGGSYFPPESSFNAYDFGSGFDVVGCPAPWVKIQMADGSTIQAGDLKPGMQVWTQHEHTEQWGAYPVIAVSTVDNNRQRLLLEDGREFVGSDNHRVKTNNGWTQIVDLKPGDKIAQEHGEAVVKQIIELDAGPVVKITVQDAHTYVSEGFLSHNVKIYPSFGGYGGGGGGSDWRGMSLNNLLLE